MVLQDGTAVICGRVGRRRIDCEGPPSVQAGDFSFCAHQDPVIISALQTGGWQRLFDVPDSFELHPVGVE